MKLKFLDYIHVTKTLFEPIIGSTNTAANVGSDCCAILVRLEN